MTTDHRSPDEIERDIVRTQNEMSRTVDRLGDQFSLRSVVNSLLDKAEENDVEARRIYDGARRNPLALALVSAGAIWLVSDYDAHPRTLASGSSDGSDDDLNEGYGSNSSLSFDTSHERDHRNYINHLNTIERRENEDDLAYQKRRDDARATFLMIERRHDEDDQSFRDRLDDATNKLRERRDQMAEDARRKHEELKDDMRRKRENAMEKARDARSKVTAQSQRRVQQVSGAYERNPLIGGAIAAIVGLVAGSAAPATRKERELIGDHAEATIETAKQKTQEAAEQARAKKDEAVAKAEKKVDPDNSSDGTKGERVTLHG